MLKRNSAPRFPWRGGPWDWFTKFMLSKGVQTALQLVTGTFFVSLFVLVNPLRFNRSCLSTIFFLAAELVVAQDQHVGSHLFAGCALMGQLVLGIVWAGLMVMLAHAPHVAYTTFLVIFGCLGFLPIAALRAQMGPPALGVNLGYAITILNAQFGWGAGYLWGQILVPLLYLAFVTAAGCFVAGLLMLSTLASDELRDVLSDTLAQVGETISGYASHMLIPVGTARAISKASVAAAAEAGITSSLGSFSGPPKPLGSSSSAADFAAKHMRPIGPADPSRKPVIAFFEQPGLKEYHDQLWAATDPTLLHGPAKLTGHGRACVTLLLPRIQLARRLMVEAMAEPPFLSRHRVQIKYWGGAIGALETLILRAGSLEAVLTMPEPLLDGAKIEEILGVDVLPTLRVLYAEIAACCSSMATAMKCRKGLQHIDRFGRLFDVAWPALEAQLKRTLQEGMNSCKWTRWENWSTTSEDILSLQMRALMYVATLTAEIMRAVAAVEAAWEEAAAHQTTLWPFPHMSRHADRYARDPEGKAAKEASAKHAVKTALDHASHEGQPTAAAAGDSANAAGSTGVSSSAGDETKPSATGTDEEADLLEAGRLIGGASPSAPGAAAMATPNGTSTSDSTAPAGSQAQTPPHIATPAAEDISLRRIGSGAASAQSPRSPQSPASPTSSFRSRTSSHLRRASIPRILREFQDATNTTEDAPRPPDEPPKPVEQLKSEQPWRWSKAWWANEVAWLKFLLPVTLALNIPLSFRAIFQTARRECRGLRATWRAFRTSRKWHFFVKYWVVCAGCLVVIFPLVDRARVLQEWSPFYVIFTAVVVLSERVEATVQKGFFRFFGTVIGGVVGYLTMLRPVSARSPYIIMTVNCVWVAVAAFIALKAQFRYGVFLTLATTLAITLCEYVPNAPPGYHGTVLYFYSRIVDIVIGLFVVVGVDIFILPWYSSESALETLGAAFEDACVTLGDFHNVFHHQLAVSACGENTKVEAPEVENHERKALEERIGRRLAEVQTLLTKEVVLWNHGYLAMPQIVLDLQSRLSSLLVRMTAVEALLGQQPLLTGRYTAAAYQYISVPLRQVFDDIHAASAEVGRTTAVLLAGDDRGHVPAHLEEADAAMRELIRARLQLRVSYLQTVQAYRADVTAGKVDWRSPDDSVRWMGYAFGMSDAIDSVILFSNTARANLFLAERCTKGGPSDIKRRSWLGLKPRGHAASVNRDSISVPRSVDNMADGVSGKPGVNGAGSAADKV